VHRKGQEEPQGKGNIYRIHLRETLDDCWARRFDDWSISHEDDGTIVLVGPVRDQAALHRLLCRVRDLGLALLAITCIGPEQPGQSAKGGALLIAGPLGVRR
jgi:hypothetical protein